MILAAPILVPLLGATFALLAWRRHSVQRFTALGAGLLLFASAIALFGAVRAQGVLSVQNLHERAYDIGTASQ